MKVKGFQVAPAELEGCLLDHPDVSNACVVGVPDDYSASLLFLLLLLPPLIEYGMVGGEVPLAFIVLSSDASKRVEADRGAVEVIKASIIHVRYFPPLLLFSSPPSLFPFLSSSTSVTNAHRNNSTSLQPKCITNTSQAGSSSYPPSRLLQAVSCSGGS